MPFELKPAAQVPFEQFVATFNHAYADYYIPIEMDMERMDKIISRDAIDLNASVVAFHEEKPVGVGMLAAHQETGWIGGLGVIPSHRARGLGRKITLALLENARQLGLKRIQLEVIEQNHAAFNLYQSLNFETMRRLLLVECQPQAFEDYDDTLYIEDVPPLEAVNLYYQFHQQENPWQRRYEALTQLDSMDGWIAQRNGKALAYAAGWMIDGVIRFMDLGVAAGEAEALRELLKHIHTLAPYSTGGISNLAEDDPAWGVLASLGYYVTLAQYEMQLRL